MRWLNITSRQLDSIAAKLSLEPVKRQRRAPHPVYWYYLDGKKTLRVTFPNIHGGSGSVSPPFLKRIRDSLKVDSEQLEGLAECPLGAAEYEAIVRAKFSTRSR